MVSLSDQLNSEFRFENHFSFCHCYCHIYVGFLFLQYQKSGTLESGLPKTLTNCRYQMMNLLGISLAHISIGSSIENTSRESPVGRTGKMRRKSCLKMVHHVFIND